VYRTAASREEPAAQEPAIGDWMERIAPGMGAFAPAPARPRAVSPLDARAGVDDGALAAAKRQLPRPRSTAWKVLALWVLLILLFIAIWQLLAPSSGTRVTTASPADTPSDWWSTALTVAVGLAVFAGLLAYRVLPARRAGKELLAATRAVALDDPTGAERLTALMKGAPAAFAAQASHWLAELAEKRGDFAGALATVEAGLAKLNTRALETATSDFVLPSLLGAFCKLLLGRRDEAIAEMALIAERFPSFPFLARTTFRVQLVDAARRGDITAAAELAAAAQDLAITPREELLADVTRVPEAERTRIEAALRADPESARWIELAAPEALRALARAGEEAGDRTNDDAAREADAEAEVEAEAEADARVAERVASPDRGRAPGTSRRSRRP
jgi:hypothetical protein